MQAAQGFTLASISFFHGDFFPLSFIQKEQVARYWQIVSSTCGKVTDRLDMTLLFIRLLNPNTNKLIFKVVLLQNENQSSCDICIQVLVLNIHVKDDRYQTCRKFDRFLFSFNP